ncbi:sulfatase-like hydrolase/transferase [bacterium]|nr:sulfatase-like hydrolase/transferase [bacterium]
MGFTALTAATGVKLQAKQKPNFVLIMADDLGYGDISCYGNERINTPHIDAMAKKGLKFTDYHANAPVCTPTRAALLTGRYQQRCGMEGVIYVRGDTRLKGMPLDALTFAEVLQKEGYQTGIFGKWHLGYRKKYNPIHQGFDQFHGYVSGNIDYISHYDNAGIFDWWHNDLKIQEKGYSTDLFTDYAVNFIENHKDEPFCVYVPHEAPHWPYQGRDDKADRFPNTQFDSRGSRPDRAAAYKEMVEAMDDGVGRIVSKLQELGLEENTLVVFCSDNGGVPKLGDNGGLRGDKASLWEGGHRVPAVAYWPGTIEPGVTDQLALSMDWFPTMVSLAGADIPRRHKLDGVDLTPVLLKQVNLPQRTVFWRYRKHKVARQGPWKLLVENDKKTYLFNLKKDRNETNNLADAKAEKVDELKALLANWEKEMDEVKQITT